MFFIFGINTKQEKLNFDELKICKVCGSYGRFEAFVKYTALSLFFIPVFKWGKKYFVKATCCGSIFQISDELGRDIEWGRVSSIRDEDLIPVNTNYYRHRSCTNCGYSLEDEHVYCPKCGTKN